MHPVANESQEGVARERGPCSIHLLEEGCRIRGFLRGRSDERALSALEDLLSESRSGEGERWLPCGDALLPEGATIVMLNGAILGCTPDGDALHARVRAMRREDRDIPFDACVVRSARDRCLSIWTDAGCLMRPANSMLGLRGMSGSAPTPALGVDGASSCLRSFEEVEAIALD